MISDAILSIDFTSFWRCGTGRGVAAVLDTVVARDDAGLPMVPGRTVKGVLRDAVRQASLLGHCKPNWLLALFGSSGFHEGEQGEVEPLEGTDPGRLQVSSAMADETVRNWVLAAAGRHDMLDTDGRSPVALRETLFETLGQTAINANTGIARDHSLRVTEVALPLNLTARLTLISGHPNSLDYAKGIDVERDWLKVLEVSSALISGFGGYRSRGLGRCSLAFVASKG